MHDPGGHWCYLVSENVFKIIKKKQIKKKIMYIFLVSTVSADGPALLGAIYLIVSSGGCFSIKMLFYQYRDPHFKDKTVAI